MHDNPEPDNVAGEPWTRRDLLAWVGRSGFAALFAGAALGSGAGSAVVPPWEEKRSSMAGRTGGPGDLIGLGRPLEPADGARLNEDPSIALDAQGQVWLAYVAGQGVGSAEGEAVVLARLGEQGLVKVWSSDTAKQGAEALPKSALHPRLAVAHDGTIVLVWAVCIRPGHWRLLALVGAAAAGERNWQVSIIGGGEGTTVAHPALLALPKAGAVAYGQVLVTWQQTELRTDEENREPSTAGVASPAVKIYVARLSAMQWSKAVAVDSARLAGADARRPSLAWYNEAVYMACDCALIPTAKQPNPNSIRIEVVALRADGTTTAHSTFEPEYGVGQMMAPCIAAAPGGKVLWVGWHQNLWDGGVDIPRWFALRAVRKDGSAFAPDVPPPGKTADDAGQVQGFEFVHVHAVSDERVWIGGRASHNFQLQVFDASLGWSPLVRLPVDGWGGRGRTLEMVAAAPSEKSGKSERFWLARRDLNRLLAQELTTDWSAHRGKAAPARGAGAADADDASAAQRAAVAAEQGAPARPRRADQNTTTPRLLPWAGADSAKAKSDRLPDPLFTPSKLVQVKQPGAAVSKLPNHRTPPLDKVDFEPWGQKHYYFGDIHGHCWMGDGTGDPDEYYLTRRDQYGLDFAALTEHDTFVGATVTPTEFEYLKSFAEHYNQPGRFATLFAQEYTTGRPPKGFGHICLYSTRADFPRLDHTDPRYDTQPKLYAALKSVGGIAIPHHVGWTGIHWEYHDPEVEPCLEIVSVHGAYEYLGNEPIGHRGGLAGNFVQDGLAKGLRYGIVGSNDCHGLIFQHGVARKRDPFRAGWIVAMAPRLTRQDIFDAIRQRRCYATSGIRLRMEFEVDGQMMGSDYRETDAAKPRAIRVAVNSEERIQWVEIVRNNAVIYKVGGEGNVLTVNYLDRESATSEDRTHYYYARITCHSGDMAWSSPIWVSKA